jgi:kinesin family protein 15
MIANISPSSCSYLETTSTLKFAQRAKMIRNDAVINEDTSANVSQLKCEIRKLKQIISEIEFGRASMNCEATGPSPTFVSPSSKTQNHKFRKADDVYMRPEGMHDFMISPSMLSSHLPEDADCDQYLLHRVKNLEKLLKMYLDQTIKTAKFYEVEMQNKDTHTKQFEKAVEEFEKCLKIDQMIIDFRDNTIAKLKEHENFDPEMFNNNQVETLTKEVELLHYKLKNNPEVEALKAKCQKLEYENSQLKGTSLCEAQSLPEVLNSIIDLNEMTQKHMEQ